METRPPVIGITLDQEPPGHYASTPWYALRENYADALQAHGATVLALAAHSDSIEHYLEICDGFLISGGGFDIDPALYGAEGFHASVQLKPTRTRFERALIETALKHNKPILGICGGEQLLAALLGAKLVQHIPDEIPQALNHSPSGSIHDPVGIKAAHSVQIVEGTVLHQILGSEAFSVNSSHHQAVAADPIPEGLVINAMSPDGVVEGIEAPAYQFCIGVQWHPEYQRTVEDQKLFKAFIKACR